MNYVEEVNIIFSFYYFDVNKVGKCCEQISKSNGLLKFSNFHAIRVILWVLLCLMLRRPTLYNWLSYTLARPDSSDFDCDPCGLLSNAA